MSTTARRPFDRGDHRSTGSSEHYIFRTVKIYYLLYIAVAEIGSNAVSVRPIRSSVGILVSDRRA
jgi:hypothetical protein